jgi:23S rRNA (cytosine1962-C5)-methyltransferase
VEVKNQAQEDLLEDKNSIISKIKSAIKYREDFFKSKDTTAFRIFNSEGDGISGLTIDYFAESSDNISDGYCLLTWFNTNVYSKKDIVLDALESNLKCKGFYQKKKFNSNDKLVDNSSDFISGEKVTQPIIVKENGVNFAIYLDDGAMVGVFLDQRDVRKTIKDKYSAGKTMLNTFSYTGAFSVFASLGGAIKTTSVDLANRSLQKTKEQFKINNIDIESQDIIVQDVFEYFKYALKKKKSFDLVVLDPPSFARTKKITFSVSKDYVKLLKEAIQITNKNGIIVASTNYANINMWKFRDFIDMAFKQLNTKYKIVESFSLPKDFKVSDSFREGDYLKVLFILKS